MAGINDQKHDPARGETHGRMAGINDQKHDTCSKPAMSITGDPDTPWSTTGSSAAHALSTSQYAHEYAASAASCCSKARRPLLSSAPAVPRSIHA